MATHQVLRLKLLVRFQFPQPYTGVIMERKPAGRKGLSFWKSYSFLLTLVLLVGLTCVSAFAAVGDFTTGEVSMEFRDGRLGQLSPWGTWTALNTTGLSTALNHGVNLTAAGGGLSQAELDESLENYIGKRVSSYLFDAGGKGGLSVAVSDLYDAIALNQIYSTKPLYATFLSKYLNAQGGISQGAENSRLSVADLLGEGFLGLRVLIDRNSEINSGGFSTNHADLTGFRTSVDNGIRSLSDNLSSQFSILETEFLFPEFFPSGIPDSPTISRGEYFFEPWDSSDPMNRTLVFGRGLAPLLMSYGSYLQADLAKLRYVLASDQDIEIAKKNEPVKDAIEDNFVGDAPGAVKPGNVDDMAGISNDLQGALNTGANAGDVLGFINGSEGWGFFSQAVADDLHQIPSSAHEEEEDFIHFYDPSVLDAYLSGGVG